MVPESRVAAHSRRVVGWELSEDLRAELSLGALDRALSDRCIEPGIVHHSDRGVQYCCQAYIEKLQAHGFVISMSRAGNPYDNRRTGDDRSGFIRDDAA